MKGLWEESKVVAYLDLLKGNIWPEGELRSNQSSRTTEEKLRTREEANRKLSSLVPGQFLAAAVERKSDVTYIIDLAANMIGRTNARRGARRIFAVLQNRRLNQHIVYSIVDEVGPFPWICSSVDNFL